MQIERHEIRIFAAVVEEDGFSREAAKELCWERERERLAALADTVMARHPREAARA